MARPNKRRKAGNKGDIRMNNVIFFTLYITLNLAIALLILFFAPITLPIILIAGYITVHKFIVKELES